MRSYGVGLDGRRDDVLYTTFMTLQLQAIMTTMIGDS